MAELTPRDEAEVLADLVADELEAFCPIGRRIIAARLESVLSPHVPRIAPASSSDLQPMGEAEAARYGATALPFGRYGGKPVSDAPLAYLEWLADASRATWLNLHRYLNSPAVKRERE